ncbi:MAG: hypothetical protein U9N13_08920 [Euryarchaeota archaeon]|nr:hypothetical protein [Euryarchaeota archaeon]
MINQMWGGDYIDYGKIIKSVSYDVSTQHTLSKSTFYDIINWKSARTKGKLRSDYNYYADAIRNVLAAPEHQRVSMLVELQGIGVAIGSTILHFIYPEIFPIMDVRVINVLRNFGYLKARVQSISNYKKYHKIILGIEGQSKYSLREIDRALFAYDKIELNRHKP